MSSSPPSQRAPAVGKYLRVLIDISQTGGQIEGSAYNSMRSNLSKMSDATRMSDPPTSQAFRGLRDALDSAMGRSVTPEDKASWEQARRQYAKIYKLLEKAAAGAGEKTAEGYISPAQLRTAAASGNKRGQYARGQGDLADIGALRCWRNVAIASIWNGSQALCTSLNGGSWRGDWRCNGWFPGAAIGALAMPAATALAGRAVMSGPVQAYLGNQLAQRLGLLAKPTAGQMAIGLLNSARGGIGRHQYQGFPLPVVARLFGGRA